MQVCFCVLGIYVLTIFILVLSESFSIYYLVVYVIQSSYAGIMPSVKSQYLCCWCIICVIMCYTYVFTQVCTVKCLHIFIITVMHDSARKQCRPIPIKVSGVALIKFPPIVSIVYDCSDNV